MYVPPMHKLSSTEIHLKFYPLPWAPIINPFVQQRQSLLSPIPFQVEELVHLMPIYLWEFQVCLMLEFIPLQDREPHQAHTIIL